MTESDKPRSPLSMVVLMLALVVVLGGTAVLVWFTRGVGATCRSDRNCNSQRCLLEEGREGICTEVCAEDADCPDDMFCGEPPAEEPGFFAPVRDETIHLCLPMAGQVLETPD